MSNSGVLVVIDMGKIKNIDINPTIDPKPMRLFCLLI